MIAAFSKLNLQIIEIGVARIIGCQTFCQHIFVFLVKSLVDSLLNSSHLDVYNGLLKGRDRLFNIFFHSPQHIWLKYLI